MTWRGFPLQLPGQSTLQAALPQPAAAPAANGSGHGVRRSARANRQSAALLASRTVCRTIGQVQHLPASACECLPIQKRIPLQQFRTACSCQMFGAAAPKLHCRGLQAGIGSVLALAPGEGRHALVVKLWRKDSQVPPVCHCN